MKKPKPSQTPAPTQPTEAEPNTLTKEDTPAWENLYRGAFSVFVEPFALMKRNTDYPYLNEVREKNKFKYLGRTIATLAISLLLTLIVLTFTTDDFDFKSIPHLNFKTISTDITSFTFYIRDAPMMLLLMSYSLVFFGATTKYLKVFEPQLVKECDEFLNTAKSLVHIPQVVAIVLLGFGGKIIWLPIIGYFAVSSMACIFAALLFAYAALFPRMLERNLRNKIVDLHNGLDPKSYPCRRYRLEYIREYRLLGFVYRGWAALNIMLAIFVLFFTFLPGVALLIFDVPNIHLPAILASYAIIACVIIFSTAGAARSYSREVDIRYFNAVEILNREYILDEKNQDGADLESKLKNMNNYSIENDPTILGNEPAPDPNLTTAMEIGAIFESTRFISSLAFAVFVYISSNSISFALSTLFAMLFSFIFNDLTDYTSGKDNICHPDRPLPSGRLRPETGVILAILLGSFFVIQIIVSSEIHWAAIALFLGGATYSANLKRFVPQIATPFWCLLLAFVLSSALNFDTLGTIALWLSILSRELVLDIRDASYDFQFNQKRNIAFILNPYEWEVVLLLALASSTVFYFDGKTEIGFYVLLVSFILSVFGRFDAKYNGLPASSKRFGLLSHLIWPFVLFYG